jgi:hypothetical protein
MKGASAEDDDDDGEVAYLDRSGEEMTIMW